jgi:hypothetical protein
LSSLSLKNLWMRPPRHERPPGDAGILRPGLLAGVSSHAIFWAHAIHGRYSTGSARATLWSPTRPQWVLRFTSLNEQERSITNGLLLRNSPNKAGGRKTSVANFVEQTGSLFSLRLPCCGNDNNADRCPAGDRNRIDLHRSITRRTTCAATDIRDAPRIHFPRLNHPEFVT